MSDCGYLERRKFIDLDTAIGLLPEQEKELKRLNARDSYRDEKFTWLPYQQQGTSQPMLAFDELWERKTEKIKILFDAATGREWEFNGDESILALSPDFQIVKKTTSYVNRNVFVNREHMLTEKNPYGMREYPFVPFFCFFYPEAIEWSMKCQGLATTMIDPQVESNKRRSQMIDLVESQITTGWIAEDGSVINPRALFMTGQGKVLWKKKGSDPNAITRIEPPNLPPAFFEMKNSSDQDIQFVANISEELLAQATNENDSGLKVALKQGASLVGLQGLFDSLRYSQKLLSKKIIQLIPAIGKAKIARILGEEPSPKLFDQRQLKYDIQIQEGLLTSTQQQMFFAQLLDLKAAGELIPPGLLAKAAPLQGKTEYNRAIEEYTQQQQQQAAEQSKVQDELLQSQNILARSQALSDMASAKGKLTSSPWIKPGDSRFSRSGFLIL